MEDLVIKIGDLVRFYPNGLLKYSQLLYPGQTYMAAIVDYVHENGTVDLTFFPKDKKRVREAKAVIIESLKVDGLPYFELPVSETPKVEPVSSGVEWELWTTISHNDVNELEGRNEGMITKAEFFGAKTPLAFLIKINEAFNVDTVKSLRLLIEGEGYNAFDHTIDLIDLVGGNMVVCSQPYTPYTLIDNTSVKFVLKAPGTADFSNTNTGGSISIYALWATRADV